MYEAIVASAIKMSTCVAGKVRYWLNGDFIPNKEKITLKALMLEPYVFFVPYDVPKKTRYVANHTTPIGHRFRASMPHMDMS